MTKANWIDEFTGDPESPALRMDGFDDCAIGWVERFGMEPILCYDKGKVLQKLMSENGMSMSDALEWFHTNQLGAWMGEGTPCFLTVVGGVYVDNIPTEDRSDVPDPDPMF